MKKLITFSLKKKLYQGLGKAVAAVIFLGMASPCVMHASAEEANRSETYIYHQHVGNDKEEGGCYNTPLYHVHTGDKTGGGCYGTAVYHVHLGNEILGGGCYGTVVYHEHTGSVEEGGGCYVPKLHQHESSCYRTVSGENYGCYTVKTEDTGDGDYEGHDYKYYYMSCGQVVYGTNSSHTHEVIDCNKEYDPDYILGCGKTENSIENYLMNCGRIEGKTIDSYALSCGKTTEDIEGYEMDCGRDENAPVGKITVTEEKGSKKEETTIKVSFVDLSEGHLHLPEEPFVWYGPDGQRIGTGESISVSENGNYSVILSMENEDINKDSLKAGITIRSIVNPSGDTGGNSGKDDGGKNDDNNNDKNNNDNDNGNDNDGGDDSNGDKEEDDVEAAPSQLEESTPSSLEESTPSSLEESTPSPLAEPTPSPLGTVAREKIATTPVKKENTETGNKTGMAVRTPAPSLKWQEKKESIKLPSKQSQSLEIPEIKIKEQKKTFAIPAAVKIITVTAGALLAALGSFFLLYYLRMSVKLYNDDGKGGMIYLGRCAVKLTEDGYTMTISDEMEEKAVTNRYYIRPGLFRFFRGEDEELIVCRLKKKISVYLSKEMTIVI